VLITVFQNTVKLVLSSHLWNKRKMSVPVCINVLLLPDGNYLGKTGGRFVKLRCFCNYFMIISSSFNDLIVYLMEYNLK